MADADEFFSRGDDAQEAGDFDLARVCFEQGAASGDVFCLSRLAYLYDLGIGVPIDKRRARGLYLRAWRLGCHIAGNNLAVLHREDGNHGAMARWFRRALERGDDGARVELAKCYLQGLGVEPSPTLALRHLQVVLAGSGIVEWEREEAEALVASLMPRLVRSQG
jgi:TPR repeat protein